MKTESPSTTGDSPLRSLVAGACAGAFSKTVTAPIERVKLLLQLRDSSNNRYGSTVRQVVVDVYRQEGLLSFWRGNTPSVIQKAGNSALNFMLMDWYKATIARSSSSRTVNSLLSGGLSGATTTTLLYPLEFLRTRLAVDIANVTTGQERQFRGMRDVFVHTVRADGIRGMYKGYGTSIWYVALHRLVYLGGFDVMKREILIYKNTNTLTMMERVASAQSISMLAATVCYPLDTVRRRLMMQAGRTDQQYRNWWDCTKQVYTTESWRGFFRGLGPNLAKTVGGALLLVAYDSFRGVM